MSASTRTFHRRHFLCGVGVGIAGLAANAPAIIFGARPIKPEMSHRERIEKALAMEETDRLPFGFWWHFPNQDRAPRRLAQLSLELQQKLDLDFIKFSPYGLYSVVDWGVVLDVPGGQRPPVQAEYPIQKPEDWRKLTPLRGTEGEYLVVLEAQRIALAEMRERVPLIQTVFSPLTTALKLASAGEAAGAPARSPGCRACGPGDHRRNDAPFRCRGDRPRCGWPVLRQPDGQRGLPDAGRVRGVREEVRPGGAGGRARPRRGSMSCISTARRSCSIEVLDYPVQALNYHDREAGPSLAEMRKRTNKCLIGGIGQNTTLVHGTPADVDAQVQDAWRQVHRRGLILGPGCVASSGIPEANVLQLRKSVEKTAS